MLKDYERYQLPENLRGQSKKIILGIPVLESVPAEAFSWHLSTSYELGMFAAVNDWPTAIIHCPPNRMPHDTARMDVMELAIELGLDYVFFIDDDNILPRGAVKRLMETMLTHKPAVVVGHYLRRGFPYTSVWSVMREGQWFQVDAPEGLHQIHTAGLGCAVIDVNWVKKHLSPPWFVMKHNGRNTGITDDISFFEMVNAAGGVVIGDAEVKCGHFGKREMIWMGNGEQLRRTHVDIVADGELGKLENQDLRGIAIPSVKDTGQRVEWLPQTAKIVDLPAQNMPLHLEGKWNPKAHVIAADTAVERTENGSERS